MACHGVELRGRGDKTVNARATTTGAPWEERLTGRGSRGPIHGFSGPEHLRSNRFFLAEGSVSCLAALVEAGMRTMLREVVLEAARAAGPVQKIPGRETLEALEDGVVVLHVFLLLLLLAATTVL